MMEDAVAPVQDAPREAPTVEMYLVPGTGTYVVAEPRAGTHESYLGRLIHGSAERQVLSEVNSTLEQDGARLALYTESGSAYDVSGLKKAAESLDSYAVGRIKSDIFNGAFIGYFLYPYGLAISALDAVDAVHSYRLSREAKRFERNTVKTTVEKDEALGQLKDLYNELDIVGKRDALDREWASLGFFQKLFPKKEVRERIAARYAELSQGYTALAERARGLATEKGDDGLLGVAAAYEMAAKGNTPILAHAPPERDEGV